MMLLRALPTPLLRTLKKTLTRCIKLAYVQEHESPCPPYLSKIRDLSILPRILQVDTPWWNLALDQIARLSIKSLKTAISFSLWIWEPLIHLSWRQLVGVYYCGETSAWPGICANFNPTNLAPPKHHARLRCASFGWHVLQRKSYPHGQAMPQKHWSKNAKVLGQKKLCWKCWGKKSLRWTRKSHIGTLLPRDVSLHDCRHIEIDA